jgi:hypothetical protein
LHALARSLTHTVWTQIEIGQQIEAYWWVTSRHLLPHMGDMIWTLGPNGLQVRVAWNLLDAHARQVIGVLT